MSADAVPGRTRITTRAQERVLGTLAADELGVARRSTRARVVDDGGRIAVRITAPGDVSPGSPPLLTRVEATRARVSEEGSRLTGAAISEVTVRITHALTDSRRLS